MANLLFKVWSVNGGKKAIVCNDFNILKQKGCMKLNIENTETVKAFLDDGTEIDETEVLQALPSGTIIYLLRPEDKKPWSSKLSSPYDFRSPSVCSSNSLDDESNSINAGGSCESWPSEFVIPKYKFSHDLKSDLATGNLRWATKSELLCYLSQEVKKYTNHPTLKQREQVAKALLSAYPALKSDIGNGHIEWAMKLHTKMRENRQKSGVTLKRKKSLEERLENKARNFSEMKLPRQEKMSWSPARLGANNKLDRINWLANESKRDSLGKVESKISEEMRLNFEERQKLINSGQALVTVKQEYPLLFTTEGIKQEFYLLMGVEIAKTFNESLSLYALKLINIAEEKKNVNTAITGVLDLFSMTPHAERNIDHYLVTALRLLPLLFSESEKFFYKEYPSESTLDDIKTGPTTPHVAIIGSICHSSKFFVVGENEILINANGFVESIIATFALYYCCNIKYPQVAVCTYKFIQLYLLKIQDTRVPAKLISLYDKLI